MLVGDKIYLTPLRSENVATIRGWLNDPAVRRWTVAGNIPLSEGQERAWFERIGASSDHYFEVRTLADDELVGDCELVKVDLIHRNGQIGIAIGKQCAQGKGYGSDAIVTLLRFAFHTLGLHTVQIGYIDGNEGAARLYSKLGFTYSGRHREFIFLRGAFRDAVELDMTREEFDARYGQSD